MKKTLIPLFAAVILLFAFAPDAAACAKCSHNQDYSYCDYDFPWFGNCYTEGTACYAYDPCGGALSVEALSTEFTVVSVERIDDAKQPAETLVARAEVSEAKR